MTEKAMRAMLHALAALAALLIAASSAAAQNNMCATQLCMAPVHYLSAASTNATAVKAQPGAVYSIVAQNTTTTIYYLKLYDKATAPTCASDPVKATIPLPATPAAGTGIAVVIDYTVGLGFNAGIGFCLTAGIADNDNTNAATGVAINFGYR